MDGRLCRTRVLTPPEEGRIEGGQLDYYTGDYTESGIERANENRDVWTAGALRYWQKHGENRQTVVYAVSVDHASNLANVFNDVDIPAGALLADTPGAERAELIGKFLSGALKALINIAVATEGFDLPDAACVLMTRPTMSLALYLQMVGRGLRHKQDGGDCVVLDLAGNSLRHGLPEEDREWSLRPRGEQPSGDAPLVRCEECEALSPASSHQCSNCEGAFGESCRRCGAWRAWKRWTRKDTCDQYHEPVCDLCHRDAHIRANLPVTEELKELAVLQEDDELSPDRNPYLKDLLEEERHRISGVSDERREELCHSVEQREAELADDDELNKAFVDYIAGLPMSDKPQNDPQRHRLYNEWESGLRREQANWKDELDKLEAQQINGQLVFNNARERLLRLLEAEAREAGLLPRKQILETSLQPPGQEYTSRDSLDTGEGMTFIQLEEWGKKEPTKGASIKPRRFCDPSGNEIAIKNWIRLLVATAECLIQEGRLTNDRCPVIVGNMTERYLIHTTPEHPSGRDFYSHIKLSNGLYLDSQHSAKQIGRLCGPLLEKFGEDPAQFHVQLSR